MTEDGFLDKECEERERDTYRMSLERVTKEEKRSS